MIITYSQAIRKAMRNCMKADPSVFVMGEDIGAYGGNFNVTAGMLDEFGKERVICTPISEAAIAGAAVGAAIAGMRPIAEIMLSDFSTLAMDQIVNHAAKMRYMSGGQLSVPVVFRVPYGSGSGSAAQHSQSLEAWFCHVPGLKVVAPGTARDAYGLLVSAIYDNNPVMFFEPRMLYNAQEEVSEDIPRIPLGKADIKREGADISVITYGSMLPKTLSAADALLREGISAEVVDIRTLVPLDEETIIASVKKTKKAIIVHEAVKRAGFGAEIAARISEKAFDYLKAPIARLCGEEVPIPFSKPLEELSIPQIDDIMQRIKATT